MGNTCFNFLRLKMNLIWNFSPEMIVLSIQILYKNINVWITLGCTAFCVEHNPLGTWWHFWNIFLDQASLGGLVRESLDLRGLRAKLPSHGKAGTMWGTVHKWIYGCLGATTAPKWSADIVWVKMSVSWPRFSHASFWIWTPMSYLAPIWQTSVLGTVPHMPGFLTA